jgi:hypothetical protein
MTAKTTETWLYAGQRLYKTSRIVHAWVDGEGVERYYTKLKALNVGGAYEIDVTRQEDGAVSVVPDVRFVDAQTATDEQLVKRRAEDAATRGVLDSKRAEKRATEDNEMDAALEVLRRHHAAIGPYGHRWAFAQWVASEVTRRPKER